MAMSWSRGWDETNWNSTSSSSLIVNNPINQHHHHHHRHHHNHNSNNISQSGVSVNNHPPPSPPHHNSNTMLSNNHTNNPSSTSSCSSSIYGGKRSNFTVEDYQPFVNKFYDIKALVKALIIDVWEDDDDSQFLFNLENELLQFIEELFQPSGSGSTHAHTSSNGTHGGNDMIMFRFTSKALKDGRSSLRVMHQGHEAFIHHLIKYHQRLIAERYKECGDGTPMIHSDVVVVRKILPNAYSLWRHALPSEEQFNSYEKFVERYTNSCHSRDSFQYNRKQTRITESLPNKSSQHVEAIQNPVDCSNENDESPDDANGTNDTSGNGSSCTKKRRFSPWDDSYPVEETQKLEFKVSDEDRDWLQKNDLEFLRHQKLKEASLIRREVEAQSRNDMRFVAIDIKVSDADPSRITQLGICELEKFSVGGNERRIHYLFVRENQELVPNKMALIDSLCCRGDTYYKTTLETFEYLDQVLKSTRTTFLICHSCAEIASLLENVKVSLSREQYAAFLKFVNRLKDIEIYDIQALHYQRPRKSIYSRRLTLDELSRDIEVQKPERIKNLSNAANSSLVIFLCFIRLTGVRY